MKNSILAFLVVFAFETFAQGEFASPKLKSLIGKTFKDEKEIPAIAGYLSRGGELLSSTGNDWPLSVGWFSKSNSILVLFEQFLPDQTVSIIDVLEIKNPVANHEIKVGECRNGDNDDMEIVALVRSSAVKRAKAVQAWRFNRDKKRIEALSGQTVTCLGAVGED